MTTDHNLQDIPPLRIEAAYSGDKLIGYALATSGTEGTNRCLVWVDQAAMPGIRLGDAFVPGRGTQITYYSVPLEAPAQPTPAPMSPANRLVAYSAATRLRELGFEWDATAEAWLQSAQPAVPQGGAYAALTHEQVSRIVDVVVERSISLTQDASGIRVAYDPNILADAIGNVLRASHGQAPAGADEKWCAYVAGIICTYLKEDAEGAKAKAIAGIIARRLMFLSRPTAQPAPAAHVQNPAEIEHVAGDVSKNRAESNMTGGAYAELPEPPRAYAGKERGAWEHGFSAGRASHGQAPAVAAPVNPHWDYLKRYWQMGFDGVSLDACTGDAPIKAWHEGKAARESMTAPTAQPAPAAAPQADSQPAPDDFQPCASCFGTGVEGDADDYGRTIDVTCGECNGSGRAPVKDADKTKTAPSRYRDKCTLGGRCLGGCLSTEPCYHTDRAARTPADSVTAPAAGAVAGPALWVSPGQLEVFKDTNDAPFGNYIPARKTSAGNFTMPLFAAAPSPAAQGDADWVQMRSVLAMLMLGWGSNPSQTMDACYAVLDSATEPGRPLAILRSAPDWRAALAQKEAPHG